MSASAIQNQLERTLRVQLLTSFVLENNQEAWS